MKDQAQPDGSSTSSSSSSSSSETSSSEEEDAAAKDTTTAKNMASKATGPIKALDDGEASSSDSTSSESSADDKEMSDASDLDGEEEVDREVEVLGGLKDLIVSQEPVPVDPSYMGNWDGAPDLGSPGFNRFAARVMWNAKIGRKLKGRRAEGECPPLQPHQEAVAFMLHPQSPISRMLVDHPTGSGKTREMICVLDNYFLDPRPKVPIFPKEPVCRNFYMELLRWPSRYRDFFACLRPQDAAKASGCADWRSRRRLRWDLADLSGVVMHELCYNMREVLEMKGWFFMGRMRRSRREAFRTRFPDEVAPAAPLRALRYTSAGGRHADLRPDGWPVSALLKVAFDRAQAAGNAYSNKVVIMDEVHNLVRLQTQYGEQLARLRSLLSTARGSVLVGFTGTPILNEASEGRQLLDIVKGAFAPPGDGGFLSSFPMRPVGLFPTSLPRGVPDVVLTPKLRRQMVHKVMLSAEALKRYDAKRMKGLPEKRLRAFCNLCVHFGSLHDGRSGSKARILANMETCAPKLFAIAENIVQLAEKALVLVAHSSGLKALVEHLQERSCGGHKFGVATMEELAEFNSPSNLRGERFRVLVADAAQCSEGVSFMAVRRLHLADVPASPSAFVQSVGRAIRMYGHAALPQDEQTVTVQLWVAVFPRWMRSPLAAWCFRAQKSRDPQDMVSGARHLLRRLLAAGVTDLDSLKLRLERCGGFPGSPTDIRPPLSLPAAATCLEQLGLWEQAKFMRQRMFKNKGQARRKLPTQPRRFSGRCAASLRKVPRLMPVKSQVKAELRGKAIKVLKKEEVKQEEVVVKKELADEHEHQYTRRGQPRQSCRPVATPQLGHVKEEETRSDTGCGDDQTLLSLITADLGKQASHLHSGAGLHGEPSRSDSGPSIKSAFAAERDPLLRMMQCLYCAQSAAEAEKELCLGMRTADEEALRNLSQRTREFVPALAAFRKKAVDRLILATERRTKAEAPKEAVADSDGQSSSIDFGLTDDEKDTRRERPQARGYAFLSHRHPSLQHHSSKDLSAERLRAATPAGVRVLPAFPRDALIPQTIAASAFQAKPEAVLPRQDMARHRSEDPFDASGKRQKLDAGG